MLTLAVMTGAAFAAIPQVSNVTMGQIAGTRIVRITYDLTQADAIITLAIETNGVALPDSAVVTLTGDVNQEITAGTAGEIIWQAGRDWVGNVADNARARITAWSRDNPPQVMVLDLSGGTAATSYPVSYYPHVDSLLDGVDNEIYKSAYLVMRRIPAGSFGMGESNPRIPVTLTKDFYIAHLSHLYV